MTTNLLYDTIVGEVDKSGDISKVLREAIINFEDNISSVEGSFLGDNDSCPLKHSFSDGIYVREITIPKGHIIVGKIHKHEHPNFLLKGEVVMVTEFGEDHLIAPVSMISKSGTKRALYAVTELVWITVHHNPTNTQDLDELEEIIIAPSFTEYEQFKIKENGIFKKLSRFLTKKLLLWHGYQQD